MAGNNHLTRALLLILAALCLGACHPNPVKNVEELDTVITLPDASFDFGGAGTYAMSDEVEPLSEDDELDHEYDDIILATIAAEMEALGYSRVIDPDSPDDVDLLLLVGATTRENTALFYYDPYYWGYYPWYGWYPGYGVGYPYYGSVGAVDFTTGTLVLDMVYPAGADDEAETLPSVWGAAINGVLAGGSDDISGRIVRNIELAFTQSPYLGAR